VTSTIAKRPKTVHLLNNILDEPDLPEIIKNLDAGLLTRLIRHVGLEDSGPIVFHATAEQLKKVFDEDLWRNEAPGQPEVFDAGRFGLWLNIMMENGPAFTACKLLEMDEDQLIMGICRLVRVVNINTLKVRPDNGRETDYEEFSESILDHSLNQAIANYHVISKDDSSWDALMGLLTQLNETHYDTLIRLLDRCCGICEPCLDNNNPFSRMLCGDEAIEEDVAAERENRKEADGFVTPVSASFFLDQSRRISLKRMVTEKTMPHAAHLYIKASEAQNSSFAQPFPTGNNAAGPPPKGMISFIETLRKAEVLPDLKQQQLGYDGADLNDIHFPLIGAMRTIQSSDPELYAQRIIELSFLSNTLISGCVFQGRQFHPKEAAEATLSTCNLGSEHLLGIDVVPKKNRPGCEAISTLLKSTDLVRMFQLGWKILFDNIILATAKDVLAFINRLKDHLSDPDQKIEISRMAWMLHADIASGRPWKFHGEMDYLQIFLDGETTETLMGLIQEYPTFTDTICKKGGLRLSPFICSHAHIRTLQNYIEDMIR
jgi:hypothetical protein